MPEPKNTSCSLSPLTSSFSNRLTSSFSNRLVLEPFFAGTFEDIEEQDILLHSPLSNRLQ
ncbi:hypothetical protein DAI22_08g083800 [Oryza sativa Japonica Group]|nr:hypothetical protein DAI22_08g083800 [Oryza sativa Japonica Group]